MDDQGGRCYQCRFFNGEVADPGRRDVWAICDITGEERFIEDYCSQFEAKGIPPAPARPEEDPGYRYGVWAGYSGDAQDPDCCVAEISDRGRLISYYQCSRKRGHGPDGKYCKQHAAKIK